MGQKVLLRLAAILVCFTLSAWGQGTTSRLTGTVLDSAGASVPGAGVTLTNQATQATFTTKTSQSGTYAFEALIPGIYSVTIEAPGFRKFVSRDNQVAIGQPTTVNATIEIGNVTEQIEVSATAEQVQTSTSGNFGNLVQERVIKDLPIVGTRGRNALDLVLLQPGVVSGGNTGGGTHVNGARDRAWNFTLDGIDTNETSAGGSNFSPLRTNPDSLAEFRVITSNATAEYGRSSGGQVTLVSKSGSNEFHGKGFWFYRTPRFNANEWENNINARGQRQFVQHIWGGDLGGPIVRNKLFFYGNLQWLRARESALTDRLVLTQQARQGILRFVNNGRNLPAGVAGASIDASGNPVPGLNIGSYNVVTNDPQRLGLDPRLQQLISNTPLPNNFFGGDGLNTGFYTFTALQQERQHDVNTRLDYILNDKNTFFGRGSWGRQDTNCDRGNGGAPLFPGRECQVNTQRDPINVAGSWRWNPAPTITNEVVVGINRFTFNFAQPFASLTDYALRTNTGNLDLAIVEGTDFGNIRTLRTWQVVDNLAWQRGAHSLKFGVNLRFQNHFDRRGSIAGLNSAPALNFATAVSPVDPATFNLPSGVNTANDLPNFQTLINTLLGRVGTRQQGFVADGNSFAPGLFTVTQRYNEFDFYAQDSWKMRRNLTIDLGLRWEPRPSPSSDRGVRVPDQLAVAGANPSQTLRWVPGKFYENRLWNFSPSVGFAWDPFESGKTSVRGNYRIAYDRLSTFLASSFVFPAIPGQTTALADQTFGQNGGRLRNVQPLPVPTTSPDALAQPPAASPNSNTVFDPNLKYPRTHQWAFSIQREIFSRTVFEISYIGRRATNLFGGYNVNQPEIFANGFVNDFNTVKAGGESALINRLAAQDARLRPGETGSQMYRRLFPADFTNNAVGTLAGRIANQIQNNRLLTELNGSGAFALIPYPQYTGGLFVIDSQDFSTYHGLQFQLERRLSNGFTGQISYVWSKSLDTRSYDPVFTVASSGNGQTAGNSPFDVKNRRLNYARSDFDRTHVIQSNFVYELPFGRGKRFSSDSGLIERVIGGWQVAGIMRWYSGRPFTVFSGFNTFNNFVNSTVDCNGCSRDFGGLHDEGGLVWYFTPEERNKMSIPAAGSMGNTGRNYFTGPSSFNLDASLLKRTAITERLNLELRADVTNVTNTPTFGFPTAVYSSPTFGRIRDSVLSSSRKLQIGAKINF
ncbi:MAG TPA: carboxypeptidase regulatory-like domain-containing protein [Bryobacteraceae bacterium]|nr:carboxypeptidase regulatory-like domain-containing protein [Bryobacteraceae bacterium]